MKRKNVSLSICVALAFAGFARAADEGETPSEEPVNREILVESGEKLVLNALDMTNGVVVRAMAGSTLKVAKSGDFFPTESQPGFTAFHGVEFPADADWPAVGTSEAEALAHFKYDGFTGVVQDPERVKIYQKNVKNRQFNLYAAKWSVAEAMTISLFEHFAAEILVILDGEVIFSDVYWNGESCKRGVAISAGEHTLVIVLATQGQDKCTPKSGNSNKNNEGRFGHANAEQIPGLVYNVGNADLNLTNLKNGISGVSGTKFFGNEGTSSEFSAYVPDALLRGETEPACDLEARIFVDGGEAGGGTVTLDLSACSNPEAGVRLKGGLLATNGCSLVVKGSTRLRVGGGSGTFAGTSMDKHWTFLGAPVSFEAPGDDGNIVFEKWATVISTPPKWTVFENPTLALMGSNALGDGDVTIDSFDVQLHTPGAVTEGSTITVGDGHTLRLKPCVFSESDCWQWAGVEGAFTNNIVLGSANARLELPNVKPLLVKGDVSGTGTVEVEYEAPISSLTDQEGITVFDGNATFKGTVYAKKGYVVFNQETPGDEGNLVKLGCQIQEQSWGIVNQQGVLRLKPAGADETPTTARIAKVQAIPFTYTYQKGDKKGTTEVVANGAIEVAKYQTMQIGTWEGSGALSGDNTALENSRGEVGVLAPGSLLRVLVADMKIGKVGTNAIARCGTSLKALEIGEMEAGGTAIIQGATPVTVTAGGAGDIILRAVTDEVPVTLQDGAALRRMTFESNARVVISGEGSVQALCGTGRVAVAGNVALACIEPSVTVEVLDGGHVTYGAQAGGLYDLGADIDPALWLDADAGSDTYRQLSLSGHPNVVYTNGSIVIDQWFDVRPWQRTYYGWNRRCDGTVETHQQVYPYLLANACNGRTTLQFDKFGNSVQGIWSSSFKNDGKSDRAGRRMPFNKPITARYAVMVFGSENGGGTCILGGWNVKDGNVQYNTPGQLRRFAAEHYTHDALDSWTGSMLPLATDWSKPIFDEDRPTWVDGKRVNPTTTGFNGKYQIVAFELGDDAQGGVPVQSLGAYGDDTRDPAGQIYGEVLVFTNALTDAQRRRVETYLSAKWGIPLAETDLPKATVDVLPGGSASLAAGTSGDFIFTGNPAVEISGAMVASGYNKGTVTLAGGSLEIPDLKRPWSESDVAATKDSQMGWYDPEDSTRFIKRTISGDTRLDAIDTILSKFSGNTKETYQNTTAFLHGYLGQDDYVTADKNNRADRRPWLVRGARRSGPERNWMDFTVYPTNDKSGNCLRFKNVWSQTTELGNANRANQNFRTAFVVTDTTKGGGNVLCEASEGNMTPTKERVGYDLSAPIWASGSRTAITGGKTYLNGAEIDGTKTGYTGRPELLTVAATGDVLLSAVGYYNGKGPDGSKEHSYEIVGETIFYKTALDDETRAGVESYLMRKWLGKLPAGFVDWTEATVSGSGEVKAAKTEALPKFGGDFAGCVTLTGTEFAFHADASGAVTDGLSLPADATIALPATATVAVDFAGRRTTCDLLSAGTITGCDLATWTLAVTPETSDRFKLKVVEKDGKQVLQAVLRGGLYLLIR